MKLKLIALIIVLVLLALAVTVVAAKGTNPAQLARAGWVCFNAGPHNWVHCIKHDFTDPTVSVKVFDTQDPGATEAEYLGTEMLMRHGYYHGQPCPQNGLAMYEDLEPEVGLPYYACHHFTTEDH